LRLPATEEPSCDLRRRSTLQPRFPIDCQLASSANLPGPELPAPRFAVAPVTDYSALDTWLFPPSTDCSALSFHRPVAATDLTRRLVLNALRSPRIAPLAALCVRVAHGLLRAQHLRALPRFRIAPFPTLCARSRSQIAPRSIPRTPRLLWIAPSLALDAP